MPRFLPKIRAPETAFRRVLSGNWASKILGHGAPRGRERRADFETENSSGSPASGRLRGFRADARPALTQRSESRTHCADSFPSVQNLGNHKIKHSNARLKNSRDSELRTEKSPEFGLQNWRAPEPRFCTAVDGINSENSAPLTPRACRRTGTRIRRRAPSPGRSGA